MMNQPVTIQTLTTRLGKVEAELLALRRDLHTLHKQNRSEQQKPFAWSDKQMLAKTVENFISEFEITGEAVEPEQLQQQMATAMLEPHELSQGIIEAREE
ncbi:MAG: hypothetical protein KA314_10500 [Chloroflexi bacterium]|nr:hypothetical protein [Chloroflexota bacterium]MBP8056264.1 hypothetical protein [Chloroflexota bacterium]